MRPAEHLAIVQAGHRDQDPIQLAEDAHRTVRRAVAHAVEFPREYRSREGCAQRREGTGHLHETLARTDVGDAKAISFGERTQLVDVIWIAA